GETRLAAPGLEVAGGDGDGLVGFTLAVAEFAHHREPRHFADVLTRQSSGGEQVAVNRVPAAQLERQREGRILRARENETRATHQLAAVALAQQAVDRMAVVVVRLEPILADGLPAQLPAIDVVPDPIHLLDAGLIERERELEQFLEPFTQV